MVDERFSAAAFTALGLNSPNARELADSLADEIQEELRVVIEDHLSKVIERLNMMGHSLKVESNTPGGISYRDDWEDASGYHCRLRVAFDSVISTGYPHLIEVP